MKTVTAFQSSTVIFASAGSVYGLLVAFNGAHPPTSAAGWWAMAGMILFSTLIAVVAFLAGLERVGPTSAAMLSTLEPVVTVALAAWMFGERLTPLVLVGGGCILLSVILLTREEIRRAAEPGKRIRESSV
jgi:drug/metabolite transporter (DMT)-like permease